MAYEKNTLAVTGVPVGSAYGSGERRGKRGKLVL